MAGAKEPQPTARCSLARPERKPKKEEDFCVEGNGKERPKPEEEPSGRLPQSVHVQIGRIRPISDRHPQLTTASDELGEWPILGGWLKRPLRPVFLKPAPSRG
jgi:hypothetical protein